MGARRSATAFVVVANAAQPSLESLHALGLHCPSCRSCRPQGMEIVTVIDELFEAEMYAFSNESVPVTVAS